MTATHDWTTVLRRAELPRYRGILPFAYLRPDGSARTIWGSDKCLLYVDGNHTGGEPKPYEERVPDRRITGKAVDNVLDASVKKSISMGSSTVAAWRDACGRMPKIIECDECNGSGTSICCECYKERDCPDCNDGKVVDDLPQRLIKLVDQNFDTTYLARMFQVLPDGPITVWLGGIVMRLEGDGWRVLMTSTTAEVESELVPAPVA